MRSSRVAKETTSRFFDNAGSSAGSLTPRRSTRSSTRLARNIQENASHISPTASRAAINGEKPEEDDDKDEIIGFGSDIEDAVITRSSLSPRPNGATVTRKRKRTTTTTTLASTTKPLKTEAGPSSSRRTRTTTTVKQDTKMELDSDDENKENPLLKSDQDTDTPRRANPRKAARKTTNPSTGESIVSPPSDWEEIYRLVKEMRLSGPAANAAVDTMGCERLASPQASPRDRRFHTLVALMLSSQTKDTVNAEAMIRLKNELPPYEEGKPPGLNLENMLAVDPALLNELIGKVGFHNNKTKYLKQAALLLRDNHNSDIPTTLEGLMSLPGVGPKMAHLCMGAENGWNKVTGIGVDVHVHRITNLWGWQSPPSKTPEETRLALESWLPRDKWKEINWLLVGFGQKVCLPVGRKCGDCELGLRGLCKSAERKKVIEGRRVKVEVKEEVCLKKVEEEEEADVKIESGDEGVKMEEEERKVVLKIEEEDVVMETTEVVDEEPVSVNKFEDDEEERKGVVKIEEGEDVVMKSTEVDVPVKKTEDDKEEDKKMVVKKSEDVTDSSFIKKEEDDVKMEY
ncbi:putative endonuclease III [Rhypophila decipiens]